MQATFWCRDFIKKIKYFVSFNTIMLNFSLKQWPWKPCLLHQMNRCNYFTNKSYCMFVPYAKGNTGQTQQKWGPGKRWVAKRDGILVTQLPSRYGNTKLLNIITLFCPSLFGSCVCPPRGTRTGYNMWWPARHSLHVGGVTWADE